MIASAATATGWGCLVCHCLSVCRHTSVQVLLADVGFALPGDVPETTVPAISSQTNAGAYHNRNACVIRPQAGHHLSSPPCLLNAMRSIDPTTFGGLQPDMQQHKRAGDASVPSPTCEFQIAKANAESMIT